MSLFPDTDEAARLRQTLAACVPELQQYCADPWIVIGSAAAWLVGAPVEVADLDVLTSTRDAQTLADHWSGRRLVTDKLPGSDRFRSHFARFGFPLPVEVMGALEVAAPGGWQPVVIDAVQKVVVDGMEVPVPAIEEQIRLLERFGRAKDRLRAELLEALPGVQA